MKAIGAMTGDFAKIVAPHPPQRVDRFDDVVGGRRRPELQHIEERLGVAVQPGVTVGDVDEEIEGLRLGELLGFAHAGGERVPRHDRLDRRERILAAASGFEQRFTDPAVETHLVVDRPARSVELFFVLVLRRREDRANDPIV